LISTFIDEKQANHRASSSKTSLENYDDYVFDCFLRQPLESVNISRISRRFFHSNSEDTGSNPLKVHRILLIFCVYTTGLLLHKFPVHLSFCSAHTHSRKSRQQFPGCVPPLPVEAKWVCSGRSRFLFCYHVVVGMPRAGFLFAPRAHAPPAIEHGAAAHLAAGFVNVFLLRVRQ
jgi:hypothetical protein